METWALLFFIFAGGHMKTYTYNGPVMDMNGVLERNWKGETYAGTEKKAKSNLAHQYKKEHGLANNYKLILPAKAISY